MPGRRRRNRPVCLVAAVFAAQLFVRHNTGKARADELAEILLDFVESLRIQGIRVRNPGLTETGRTGDWFQANANATLEYDSYRTV